jgi:hypothetical protein
MKTIAMALVAAVAMAACAPIDEESVVQNSSLSDAGKTADGSPCQVCAYQSSYGNWLQGCKTSTTSCQACQLLGCH